MEDRQEKVAQMVREQERRVREAKRRRLIIVAVGVATIAVGIIGFIETAAGSNTFWAILMTLGIWISVRGLNLHFSTGLRENIHQSWGGDIGDIFGVGDGGGNGGGNGD